MISIYTLFEYDTHFITYNSLASQMWNELIKDAKKEFKIMFDLENNDSTRQQKVITVPQDEWKHTECRFRCELYSAGGDWEYPIYYFRCQLVKGYAFGLSPYRNSHFIFIPGKTQGNYHLVPTNKDGEWRAPHDGQYKKGIDPERDDKACWKALNDYLKMLVDAEIEKVRAEKNEQSEKGDKMGEAEASAKS